MNIRSSILLVLLAALGVLAITATSALAAVKAPRTEPASAVKAQTATLNGVLSPASADEVGSTYEFLYKASTSTAKECKGGSATSPVASITGLQEEPVSEPVSVLKAGMTYAVCLVAHNAAKTEEAVGLAVVFTTLPLPSTEVPSPLSSSTATFRGKLTPLNEEVETQYIFFYNLEETPECTYETPASPSPENAGEGSAAKSVFTSVTGLHPKQKYTVCLFSFSAFGEEVNPDSPVHFETEPAPPTIPAGTESVTERKPESALLNAQVNPNNEETHYEFEYATKATNQTLEGTIVKVGAGTLSGYPEQAVSAPTAALVPGTKYYYRVVARNEQSEKEAVKVIEGEVEEFTAAIAPETPAGEEAKPIAGNTAELHGTLNPGKAGEAGGAYEFRYRQSATECEGEGELTSASEKTTGATPEPVSAKIENLLPNTTYTFCLHVVNTAEPAEEATGAPAHFTTLAIAPAITNEQATEVGRTSTKLTAQLDPGGASTTYIVQYGTSSVEEHSTPEASAGASATPVTVEQTLEALTPGTKYEVRFVVSNAVQAGVPGEDTTFTTFPPSASGLPDDRTYELVSNFAFGTDAEVYVPTEAPEYIEEDAHGIRSNLPFRVAPDGEAVVYPGDAPPTGGTGAESVGSGNELLATRAAGGGWTQTDIQPPGQRGSVYRAFSSNLSVGILSANQTELGGGPAGYEDLYAHATAGGAGGEYRPLYTGSPPNRSNEFGVRSNEFGVISSGSSGVTPDLSQGYAGGNSGTSAVPAFSQLLFEANDALQTLNVQALGGAGEDPATQLPFADEDNLYDATAGGLYLVNVLPDGAAQANASFGQVPAVGYGKPHGVSNAISADGSRIFWTALEGLGGAAPPQALYVRENATQPQSPLGTKGECAVSGDACTVQVDAAQGGPESGGGEFWTASSDGSKVFFSDCRRLTADSMAVPTPDCEEHESSNRVLPVGNDLYEYDLETGVLTDLTVDRGDAGGADVQGVLGASENGEYVYFAAAGALAGNANGEGEKATPQSCTVAGPGEGCNLYVRHAGTTTFIATLSAADGAEVQPLTETCSDSSISGNCEGDWAAPAGWRTAEVTPDGHSLVFMSNRSLTGYDNESVPYTIEIHGTEQETTERLDEVFRYEAEAESGSGGGVLTCVSCNPSGEAPVSTEFNTHHEHRPVGGFIPTSHNVVEQPRVISADGSRIFFDSGEPLSPAATNGWLGVYEWERDGTGSCTLGTGCVYLLSAGTDPENSYLLGTDSSGDNAFLISRARLVAADRGDGDVVYDARVDGVQAPAEAACEGTGCQGVPPTPPIFATPSSATITGVDDLEPTPTTTVVKRKPKSVKCKKGFTKNKKNKCVRKKTKKKQSKAKKSASNDRGTSR